MTNFEKYKEEIEKLKNKYSFTLDLDRNVVNCNDIPCCNCKFQDIVTCKNNRINWLFDEYKEKLDDKEKTLVENVGIAKGVHYRYIARDKDGTLTLFKKVPRKTGGGCWSTDLAEWFEIHNSLFPWIHHEDGVFDIKTSQFIKVE